MGEIVEFVSNGGTCTGYLAVPEHTGPGVVVIQEWWGLVDHIKEVANRFAAEGFVALAPDLFHGKSAAEPDEAGKLMMDLRIEQAAKDMSGAVDELLRHPIVEPKKVGSVGFCMGGALSLTLATIKPVDAAVTYYGLPFQSQPDYSKIHGAVLGHFADHDDWASPKAAEELFAELRGMGKTAELHVYEGTEHAFFNDTRPEVYKPGAAEQSWDRTLVFFRTHLS
jgi:carboxymethylenebutenolidase